MSSIVRPTVLCAILFGIMAAIIPRVIVPMFRPKTTTVNSQKQYHRTSATIKTDSRTPTDDFSSMSDVDDSSRSINYDHRSSLLPPELLGKSTATFGVPMYAVGIFVFLMYTCFKYYSKANKREQQIQRRYSSKNILWNPQQHRFKYEINGQCNIEDDDEQDDEYAGLDPDYVQYIKSKREKEYEVERRLGTDQRQMNSTLDSMKTSLSYINTKLASNAAGGSLSELEISQLQDRLAATEAQMYQIINALDAASTKVQELSKMNLPLQGTERKDIHDDVQNDGEISRTSRLSEESGSLSDEEENSSCSDDDEEDDSESLDQQAKPMDDENDETSSSYEEDDDPSSEDVDEEQDDESETSSNRYGLMETNYNVDSKTVEDYDLDARATINDLPPDSVEKVEEWRQRNHSATADDQTTSDIFTETETKSQ